MTAAITIQPVSKPIQGAIRPPGSKSLTNRALTISALAAGQTRLTGVLESQDTRVMIESLQRLGIKVDHNREDKTIHIEGCGGKPPANQAELWLENSGTSIRFLTALCTLGHGEYSLTGVARMCERPIADLTAALNGLGANAQCNPETQSPPVTVRAAGLPGGKTTIAGNISSQYLSALLMAAPCAQETVTLELEGELVSEPYVAMTLSVMRSFGVEVERPTAGYFVIPPQTYQACEYAIEPDASAASYFFAAAAITGGEGSVQGLTRSSLQGDINFVDVLEKMGCTVKEGADEITVVGGPLQGVSVDMGEISDTAQTLAAVAVFAEGETAMHNMAHVRHKETDRISAVATELQRMGLRIEERDDGLTVFPASPKPAAIETYDDHRMAMSFALVGLRAEGIQIKDPDCTAKTYPHFFDDLNQLCESAR